MNLFNKKKPRSVQPYWGQKDIPDLTGKLFLITGATGAYGQLLTETVYANNGSVILAGRDQETAFALIGRLRNQYQASGTLQFRQLDLNDLASIQSFAANIQNEVVKLDVLINNAGIKDTKERQVNREGIEAHFQINYFGHFVLTNLLIPLMQMAKDPRIVNVSAPLPGFANLKLNDLQLTSSYSNQRAYLQSKLAIQMATFYLQDISAAQNLGIKAMVTHPGIAKGNLQRSYPNQSQLSGWLQTVGSPFLGSRRLGILPTLFAATDHQAVGGRLYAPDGFLHLQGRPTAVKPINAALDKQKQGELWVASSELAGFSSWASMANTF
ncbi:SDR family NAD(P)-dependent oxidoreductase [Agrilactobacillus fermenti]|uniref:SDR family NAD(P)-dependent oxidoreductase n=1 Tax=Agrilactobacillus fermenti TaxID=2586909 RepID=UPI003A5C7347